MKKNMQHFGLLAALFASVLQGSISKISIETEKGTHNLKGMILIKKKVRNFFSYRFGEK